MIDSIRQAIQQKLIECTDYFGYAPMIKIRLSPHGLTMCRLDHDAVLYLFDGVLMGYPYTIDDELIPLFEIEYHY